MPSMQDALLAVLLGGVLECASGAAADAVVPASHLSLRSPAPGVLKGPHRVHQARLLNKKGLAIAESAHSGSYTAACVVPGPRVRNLQALRGGMGRDKCRGVCLGGEGQQLDDPVCTNTKRCTAARCPNFPVCGDEAPQWVFDCNGGRCINCNMVLGPLTFLEASSADDPCPVCLEAAPLRVQMTCAGRHNVCVACFRKPSEQQQQPQPQPQPQASALRPLMQ
ncbi:hypothetical protein T484DRAFT_3631389 [Baffinella frigidus]|nr:hypothetical protein T484DRAFT_3631389 [Cryptophyta sp. CCMP2293]